MKAGCPAPTVVREHKGCNVLGTVLGQERSTRFPHLFDILLLVHLLPDRMAAPLFIEELIPVPKHADDKGTFVLLVEDATEYETAKGTRFIVIKKWRYFQVAD